LVLPAEQLARQDWLAEQELVLGLGSVVVSPPFKWQKIIADSGYTARERIADPVDPHYIAELERILDFVRAYEPDGMTVEEFEKFGPTRKTLRQFLAADADLDALVRDIIVPAP